MSRLGDVPVYSVLALVLVATGCPGQQLKTTEITQENKFAKYLAAGGWVPLNTIGGAIDAGAIIAISQAGDPTRKGTLSNCIDEVSVREIKTYGSGLFTSKTRYSFAAGFIGNFIGDVVEAAAGYDKIHHFSVLVEEPQERHIDTIPIERWIAKHSTMLDATCFSYLTEEPTRIVSDVLVGKLSISFFDSTGAKVGVSANIAKEWFKGKASVNYESTSEGTLTSKTAIPLAFKPTKLRNTTNSSLKAVDDKIHFAKGTYYHYAKLRAVGLSHLSWEVKDARGFLVWPSRGVAKPKDIVELLVLRTPDKLATDTVHKITIEYVDGAQHIEVAITIEEPVPTSFAARVPRPPTGATLSKALTAIDAGDYVAAMRAFEKATRTDPRVFDSGEFLRLAGISNFKTSSFKSAESLFEAYSKRSADGILYYTLARAKPTGDPTVIKSFDAAVLQWKKTSQLVREELKGIFGATLIAALEK